jgi:hypothetical protein
LSAPMLAVRVNPPACTNQHANSRFAGEAAGQKRIGREAGE